ncbi:MAG: class I SAM-dependent methyltransferase, partial [Clostridia bacterium]|nr:class I SAM-dependent methyltransferase [Clostridia bacterium]
MDTFESLTNYYNTKDESLRLSTRHGSVEFLTTVRYVEKYLSENHRILEIGAATGKYSHYFAQKGYEVDAIELVQHNIDVFNSLTLPEEKVTVMQGNALDLSHIKDETYDITLLLGPMYHLYTVEEQLKALSEAIRVTKPKGKIFAAYCNTDMTVYQYCF